MKLQEFINPKTAEAMKQLAVDVEAKQVASLVKAKHRIRSASRQKTKIGGWGRSHKGSTSKS